MRVAQLTDLHIRGFKGISPFAFFNKRVLGGLNLMLRRARQFPAAVAQALIRDVNEQRVDHVIVSGDLTNLSLSAEMRNARDLLAQLDLGPEEVTVVPGNHDCYTQEAADRAVFEEYFAPHLTADLKGAPDLTYPFVRLRGNVAIVGLSTACPSAPLLAIGELGEQQRAAAETLLTHTDVTSRFRLVVVHHPPRVSQKDRHKRLVDGEAFCQMLGRTGADLVIHGHLHRQLFDEIASLHGPVPVRGINSSTWVSPDPDRVASYTIYHIEGDELMRAARRIYDVESGAFTSAPTSV